MSNLPQLSVPSYCIIFSASTFPMHVYVHIAFLLCLIILDRIVHLVHQDSSCMPFSEMHVKSSYTQM